MPTLYQVELLETVFTVYLDRAKVTKNPNLQVNASYVSWKNSMTILVTTTGIGKR
jgi:hypothetical protein